MVYLPETMPASFQAIYTPVKSAGTEAQIKHLARLMATQMTAAGLGPGEFVPNWAMLWQQTLLTGKAVEMVMCHLRCHLSWVCHYAEYSVSSGPGL